MYRSAAEPNKTATPANDRSWGEVCVGGEQLKGKETRWRIVELHLIEGNEVAEADARTAKPSYVAKTSAEHIFAPDLVRRVQTASRTPGASRSALCTAEGACECSCAGVRVEVCVS